MRINNFFKLIFSIALPLLAGFVGSIFTTPSIQSGWYAELMKPALSPPNWVFAPVWTVLYVLMGIAVFLIWKAGWERRDVKIALGIFTVQLLLNTSWSIVFFGLQSPDWALVNIVLLWIFIVWTMVVFYKISSPSHKATKEYGLLAMYLLVPYLLWVSFAVYLNFSICLLN